VGRRVSLAASVAVGPAARAGILARGSDARDGVDLLDVMVVAVPVAWRPLAHLRLDGELGAAAVPTVTRTGREWVGPGGNARVKWVQPGGGAAAEVRVSRDLLDGSPVLLASRVVRREARATLDLPVAGAFRLRGLGRVGDFTDRLQRNARRGFTGAGVLRVGGAAEVSLSAGWLGFAAPAASGYFAPRGVQTVQAGSYVELERGAWTVALDAAVGAQRVREHSFAAYGAWRRALGLYGLAGWRVASRVEMRLEVELNDAGVAPDGVSAGGGWRYASLATGMGLAF
jgi:hypothetical protein